MIIRFYIIYDEFTYLLNGQISILDTAQILQLLNISYIYNTNKKTNSIILTKITAIEITFIIDNWSNFLEIMKILSLKYKINNISVAKSAIGLLNPKSSVIIRYRYCYRGLCNCAYLIEKILFNSLTL